MTELTLELAKQLTQDAESTSFAVDFDELWQWCGYSSKHKAKEQLTKNFDKDLDYSEAFTRMGESVNHAGLSPQEKAAATRTIKYYTTPDCAKEFGMLARTEQGRTVRRYFIQAEKELRAIQKTQKLPQTYLEALKELVDSEEKRQLAEEKAKQTQGKLNEAEDVLETYRSILSPESCLTVAQVSKALGINGLGRNKLFDYLRRKDFIQQKPSVEPYQRRIDQELAVVDLTTINRGDKKVTTPQAKLTFKGLEWLVKNLKSDGYPVHTDAQAIWDFYNS